MSEGPTVFHPVVAEVTDKWVAMSMMALPGTTYLPKLEQQDRYSGPRGLFEPS